MNNNIIEIGEENIFSSNHDEFKVIAFNEYFDTKVDDIIISSKTLNGKYIKKKYDDVSILDKKIETVNLHYNSSQFIIAVIPGRSPSSGLVGRVRTANVRMSKLPEMVSDG